MKIIMNDVRNSIEAEQCFIAADQALKNNIPEGRNNFVSYKFTYTGLMVNVCKNKSSYTTYIERELL